MKTRICPLCHEQIRPLEEYYLWTRESARNEARVNDETLEFYLHVNDPSECACHAPTCPVCHKNFDTQPEQFPWLKFAIHWNAFGDMDPADHKMSSMISGE